MPWIKRNLSLVISGVIALGLLGFGGYYLWSANQKNQAIDTEIQQAKADIERLLGQQPTPTSSNLNAAKAELQRLTQFVGEAKKHFPPAPPPSEPLNNQSFKSLLQTTVDELNKQAASVGIKVETNYYYTFEAQRLPVVFPPESLPPLRERLLEVQEMASILYKARINRLEAMRRAPVPGEFSAGRPGAAPGSPGDYVSQPPRTNAEAGMVTWPYEVVFHSFTPELASVIESLQRAPLGFVVKYLAVEPAEEVRAPEPRRAANDPRAQPARAATPPPALQTIIDEKLLRVRMGIEVVKPLKST